ncbi:MAG: hypothetical protein AAB513_03770 [Patescibacteria group bacterium]
MRAGYIIAMCILFTLSGTFTGLSSITAGMAVTFFGFGLAALADGIVESLKK